ncbi:MAG: hypothetical protein H6959_06055 [Chromatiaceae bacterium]|nr:hypothetical protein [Gammaproteobacteria bacterium]MCP5300389.1 hypothetical protein [Chromatiaceae bacterium]MCP5422461.1 hypothetical protein [Chromatiaceae bacterium]
MRIPLTILALVGMVLLALYRFAPPPGPDALTPRTDLPWQITVQPDGGSRVFDLDLGRATLGDAMAKFGTPEGLAVFEPKSGGLSLEAYFGTVQLGPLTAKVVVGLAADAAELERLRATATGREGSPSGDWKYPLGGSTHEHMQRRITVISYVPGTRGLDADFFRARFGEPVATLRETEQAVSWFYPDRGVSILIDDDGREVLEYVAPRDFVLPEAATPHSATDHVQN